MAIRIGIKVFSGEVLFIARSRSNANFCVFSLKGCAWGERAWSGKARILGATKDCVTAGQKEQEGV